MIESGALWIKFKLGGMGIRVNGSTSYVVAHTLKPPKEDSK